MFRLGTLILWSSRVYLAQVGWDGGGEIVTSFNPVTREAACPSHMPSARNSRLTRQVQRGLGSSVPPAPGPWLAPGPEQP